MGLISNLLLKNYSMSDFDKDLRSRAAGVQTRAGVKVNENTALRHMTVFSCVRVRSESFASLPISVYRKRPNGKGRDEVTDHPLYEIIHAAPNDEMPSFTWRETINSHLDLSGNCYSIITFNRRGQVADLYPWPWDMIEPKRNQRTNEIEYHLNDRGKTEILPKSKVFHVPGLGYDGTKGYSIISLMREYVGLGMAVNEFIERFYGQGMNIGSVLQTDHVLKKPALDEMKEEYENGYSGLHNAHRPLILHSGLKYSRIQMPLTDAQTIETLKLNKEDICGIYRVPPHMIANLDRSTNNNIEHQGIEYVMYSMLPQTTRFEQFANWKLFTPAERAAGYYVKANVDALLRGDSAARAAYLNTKRQNGVINADEWRELDDENPIGGLAGEAYLVNGNMIGTETAAKQLPKAAKPNEGGENT
jgi:HK97 family phage portal protein